MKTRLSKANALALICAGNFLAQLKTLAMPFWLEALIAEGHLAAHLTKWVTGFEFLINAVAIALSMKIMFRFSQRSLLAFGTLVMILGNTLCVLLPNQTGFLIGRVIAAVGEGLVFALVQAMAAKTTSPQRAYSIMNGSLLVLSFAVLLLVPPTLRSFGAVGVFGLMVATAAATLPLLRFAERSSLSPQAVEDEKWRLKRPMMAAMIAVVTASVGMAGLWAYSVIVGQKLGISGEYLSWAMVGSLGGGVLGSALAIRVALIPGVGLAFILFAISAAVFGFSHSVSLYLTTICLITGASGLALPLLFSLLAKIDLSGAAAAAAPIAVMIGSGIGAFAIGAAIDHHNYEAFFYPYLFALLGGFGMVVYTNHHTGPKCLDQLNVQSN